MVIHTMILSQRASLQMLREIVYRFKWLDSLWSARGECKKELSYEKMHDGSQFIPS